MPENITYCGYR